MFRLQRLEITGFKSFADYTEILFTADGGVTAVVGPNGCGKSNVADAIAWVLGEQSAKSLRGAEMQDVIFQGTRVRQPSGMSEVVLHLVRDETAVEFAEIEDIDESLSNFDDRQQDFDETSLGEAPAHADGNGFHFDFHSENNRTSNGNGFHQNNIAAASAAVGVAETLPAKTSGKRRWKSRRATLDFAPGAAVSITRRLYRSGESEYLLNGRACRLRDINDLFSGTGLAGASYALVQQERISQILSAKPSDRRALIEEAAGISKFRTRQRAAEIRLESAKANLRRLSDIVSEVERQATSLRRQAARTRRFKELQETLRELLRDVFSAEGKELAQALNELRERLETALGREQNLAQSVVDQTAAAQKATQTAREAEENLAYVRAAVSEAALQRERVARDFAHQTEQLAAAEKRVAVLDNEIRENAAKLRNVSLDAERLREKNQKAAVSDQNDAANVQIAEAAFHKIQAEVANLEIDAESLRAELLQHTAAAERLREIARQQINALERMDERAEGLRIESERAAKTHLEKQAEAVALRASIDSERQNFEKLKGEEKKASEVLSNARENFRARESSWQKVRDEANGVRYRRETLEKLDAGNNLLAPDVQKIFAAKTKLNLDLRGTLADFINVEARFEKAVEAAFGSLLQTIVVATHEDAAKISLWLKQHNAGQINVLICPPTNEKSDAPQKQRKIGDVIGASKNLARILGEIFPQQINLRVLDDAAEAAEMSAENCVTLAGELIFRNQFFSFGKASEKNGKSILSFKRELRECVARSAELEIELSKTTRAVNKAKEELIEKENFAKNLQSEINSAERQLFSLESKFKSIEQEQERAERHARVVADETQRLEVERLELEAKRVKAENDLHVAENSRHRAVKKINEISSILLTAKQKAEKANAVISEKRAAAAADAERRRSLANALRRTESDQSELTRRLETQRGEIFEINAKIEQLRGSLAALNERNEIFAKEQKVESDKIAAATENLQRARTDADRSAAHLNELNAEAARAKDARAALEVQQAEFSTKLVNLRENCVQELGQPLEDLITDDLFDAFDLPTERRRVESLREKLDNFGAVNLLALDELTEAETRLLFLSSQKKDIVDSIESAEEALAEIKRRSRERFERAFNEINRNFSEFFSQLFGGGRGEMNLLDATDVLESGIEIVAQPPGKRLQNLLLLSGGEKAMTAIALVLAIFRFRPSPFCLLDEVDAPLDEANIGRFVERIKEMSAKTQFIVITHNKRTMEAARALYGVTMEEAGVSKVVSVKFE